VGESKLWKIDGFEDTPFTEETTKELSNEFLIKLLESVDEKSASVLHPNDRRKILR